MLDLKDGQSKALWESLEWRRKWLVWSIIRAMPTEFTDRLEQMRSERPCFVLICKRVEKSGKNGAMESVPLFWLIKLSQY